MQISDKLVYDGKTYELKSATLSDVFSGNLHTSSPLAPIMEANDLQQQFEVNFHSANMRGYLCDWEIKEDKLFLESFISRSPMIYTIDQLLRKSPPALSPQYQMYEERKKEIEVEFERKYGSISDLKKEIQKLRQPFDDWNKETVPAETKEAFTAMQHEIMLLDLSTSNKTEESEVFAEWFSGSIEVKEFDDYNGEINGLCIDISKGIVVGSTPCHVASYYGRPLKNYIED
jgi:hypothetical protein